MTQLHWEQRPVAVPFCPALQSGVSASGWQTGCSWDRQHSLLAKEPVLVDKEVGFFQSL